MNTKRMIPLGFVLAAGVLVPPSALAQAARPTAKLFGSSTMSDMVFMEKIPCVKVGPGESERSHTADEFVLESEILDAVRFYEALVRAYAERAWEEAPA